jgi:hypothetical protein
MTATLARPSDAVDIPICPLHSLSTKQVAELTLIPVARIYQLKKNLRAVEHYSEARSVTNSRILIWSAPGVTQLELTHWLRFGIANNWSQQRLKAFEVASKWMEANNYA